MNNLTTKLLDALNAANTNPGTHYTLSRTLKTSQQAARGRAVRLEALGLLKGVSMGNKTGAALMATRAGLLVSLQDLGAKRRAAAGAYAAARQSGANADAELKALRRLTTQLDTVEDLLADA